MGIYIKDIRMPVFEHQSWDIRKGTDEKWYIVDTNTETSNGEWHEIIPVPPHGKLIDADDFDKRIRLAGGMCEEELTEDFKDCIQTVLAMIKTQPTIIAGDGKGYILAPQEEYDGLKRKYVVLKSDSGEPVEDCFVLRPDKDNAAIAALLTYADTTDNQMLAKDIRAWISTIPVSEEGK